MVRDGADSSDTAGTGTRILALVPETCLGVGAVGVGQTLGVASDVGVASVVRQALADGALKALAAVGVDATG